MTRRTSEAITTAALCEANRPQIDAITHGEVAFVIRHGVVQRIEIRQSILNQEVKRDEAV